jgi:hypothetical protein
MGHHVWQLEILNVNGGLADERGDHVRSTGVPRFIFTGDSGGRPRAMRWAFVSPIGAAPTAMKAARTVIMKVKFMVYA